MTEFTEVITMEETPAPAPRVAAGSGSGAVVRSAATPGAPEFDDLNGEPGTCSWNPLDWWNEIVGELRSFDWRMTEKRRVVGGVSCCCCCCGCGFRPPPFEPANAPFAADLTHNSGTNKRAKQ